MNNQIRYSLLSLSVLFIIIYAFVPSSRQYFSYLVVLGFAVLTIYLTWDGMKIRKELQNKFQSSLQQTIINDITYVYNRHQTKYEQINKAALIDTKTNDHLKDWEKNKRYYQSLPNFLLSLGLLGTFLGITLNLILISSNLGGEVNIQTILPNIVSSMGIAFGSSLFALACSIFLVKFHPVSELEIQKENLIISLENYIDNEFLLNSQNTSKIDQLITSINQYSSTLNNFLNGLDENTKKFATAMTEATNKINTSANNFQTIINQSSQTMQTGANVLNNATANIANLTIKFTDISSSLLTSSTSLEKSTSVLEKNVDNLANVNDTLINNSHLISRLAQKNADNLQNLANTLTTNSNDVKNLMQNNQQNLTNVADSLLQNVNNISTSSQTFNSNVTQIIAALNQHTFQVGEYNTSIQQLAGLINNATLSSNNNIPQLAAMLGNQINQLQTTANQLNQNSQMLQQINSNLSVLLTNFQQFQQSQN
ncbi:MAG: methyl-accepting chemotaxis protein [Nostocales cyanobacterium]|nr:MAG: methyl-accepting chemotaxis protein [Nostocales cyanobacterium]